MSSLYEINESINQILTFGFNEECIDTETGEILEDKAKELLDKLQVDRDTKIENIALFIKNLVSEIKSIKDEETALNQRRKLKEKKADYLSSLVANSLLDSDTKKFETAKCALSFRKSEVVNIIDNTLLPEQFIKTEVKKTADKTAIKKAIKDGVTVAGAMLEEKQNLQIK